MKRYIKKINMLVCSVLFITYSHIAVSDISSDSEVIFNWAEVTFPNLFPSRQATQSVQPWLFRYYPDSGIYVGINKNDNGVYALGGIWGDKPTFIEELPSLMTQITNAGGGGNMTSCDTTTAVVGIDYRQSGNVITVTSNGQCVELPDLTSNTNLCATPPQSTASGLSVLSMNTVTSSTMGGVTTDVPGLPDTLKSIVEASANVKHCTINAAPEAESLVVNSNLCFDITTAFSETLAGFPLDGLVITPPVTYAFTGTYTNTVVEDCFATDAAAIHDAFTGETWKNQNGSFVKVVN